MATDFEVRGRTEKAKKLTRQILTDTVRVAANLNDEEWLALAAKAGCNPPSDETQAEVVRLLDEIAI